jgi:hypothetical protein
MRQRNANERRSTGKHLTVGFAALIILAGITLAVNSVAEWPGDNHWENCRWRNFCERTCRYMLRSSLKEATSDYWLALANANNLPTWEERSEARAEACEEFEENVELCFDQYEARLEVCELLEEGIYHPEIDPENFVDYIDNPYLPMVPGTTFIYEAETEDGTERIEVYVTHETREILGVECTVVRDTVTLDGELIEDTFDWFAQDVEGNVWYFGELSMEYEDGELVGLEGSWEAGEDGAKPGIIMLSDPQVGEYYRQEFALGEAEDIGGVLSLTETATVPYGVFMNCLMTEDFTAIEPDDLENKFYATDVGLVLEVNPESGERVELVDITTE